MQGIQQSLTFACVFFALISSNQAQAWGKTGHRISGALAEPYLSDASRELIADILPNESLAEAGPWADYMRANPATFWQHTSPRWHYVTFSSNAIKRPKKGDAISALALFSQQLSNTKLPLKQRQLALRFIVHIVSDLHQPLHAGNGKDRGGSKFKVKFFGRRSHLHRVWDSQIIDEQKLSYSEWADWLSNKISAEQADSWCQATPSTWAKESRAMHKDIYPKTKNPDLKWQYIYQNLPRIQLRLQQSGVRLACFLNRLNEK